MNDRAKEIIIKSILVLGCIFGSLIFLIPIFSGIFSEQQIDAINGQQHPLAEPFYTMWITTIILTVCFGILFMILLPIFGLKQKPVKAEKIPLQFDDFNSLANHIANSAKSNNYAQQPILSFANDGTLTTYVKSNGLWNVDCMAFVRVAELTDEILDSANDAITESLTNYYGKKQITDTVNMIGIFCVDRITPAFQKLVDGNIQQGFKNGRLPVGISFGGKTIYLAKQKDGFAITKYKRLRNEFLKIMKV